jgi:pimeloyl-ACP methyl ester carboxylesterase
MRLGPDLPYVLERYSALKSRTARQAFLRTLRTGVDVRGQIITMLDRCYLAAGMPTLIVWGKRDRVIPVRHAHVAHAAMPGSKLEIFEHAGHFPHHEDPDRFAGVVTDFLDGAIPIRYDQAKWREMLRTGLAAENPRRPSIEPQISSGV